jgi:enoyl-CoA hydratase/carnithine racemase
MKERYEEITVAREGHVAILEIDRPPNNHASAQLLKALADALSDIDGDKGLRASVLAAAGRSFCAGADFADGSGAGQEEVRQFYVEAVRIFSARKPIIAAVQGAAIGAGLGLALAADFRVAAPEARFSANFVKLGFHPGFAITYTLPRLIGAQKAALMCLTGRRIKPDDALAWGLVDEVVPAAALRPAALKLAAEIAGNAPLGVQATRATLRAQLAEAVKMQTEKEFAEQNALRGTADFAEGVRAVAERRPGNFIGA